MLLADPRVQMKLSKTAAGNTPLHRAAERGDATVLQLLLADHRVDVNCSNSDGLTPLHVAACQGHTEVLQLLLADRRLEVNSSDRRGCTPLYGAAHLGHSKVVRLLLADRRVDLNDLTALGRAVDQSHIEVASLEQ